MRSLLRKVRCWNALVWQMRGLVTPTDQLVPDNDLLQRAAIRPSLLKPYVSKLLQQHDPFNFESMITIENLHKARVHYGHKIGTLNDKMKWALFGERLGVCIFDLSITKAYLLRALNFLAHVAYRGGIILFVSSDRNNMLRIEEMAESAGEYAHIRRWHAGTLTNMKHYSKFPVRLPDTIVFLSTLTTVLETHPAVIEAAQMAIPTIGVVDSNSDPSYVTYLIPGNDDSTASVLYFMDLFVKAIECGKKAREDFIKEHGELEQFAVTTSG